MKRISLYLLVLLFTVAGINHFVQPGFYLKIMPAWLPLHEELVFISGVAEIAGALLLLNAKTRHWGAWFIIVLLIAVFPANIQMLLNYQSNGNPMRWIAILRLPLQFLLIWWACIYTKPAVSAG